MTTIILLLIIFTIIYSELSSYIKKFKAGYKGESDQSFWMMSYDFKPHKKEDYKPDTLELINWPLIGLLIVIFLIWEFTSSILADFTPVIPFTFTL